MFRFMRISSLLLCAFALAGCGNRFAPPPLEAAPAAVTASQHIRVNASPNDAEEVSGGMQLGGRSLDFSSGTVVGVRFGGVDIPQGAKIASAHIEFRVGATAGGNLTLNIRGDAKDHAGAYTSSRGNISARAKTAAAAVWTPYNWTVNQTARTANLTGIVQEIVNRGGWRSGNALAFTFRATGSAQRPAVSYDKSRDYAPVLVVSLSPAEPNPGPAVPPPVSNGRSVIRTPLQPGVPRLLFGQGPVGAERLRDADLVTRANLRMLSTWYNGPNDLGWHGFYKTDFVPNAYRQGYALHVIVFTDDAEVDFETPYGTACGRPYPLMPGFLSDMHKLAQTWAGVPGDPPLYFTLFTEFQTYACTDNTWNPDSKTNNYYRALKDVYRKSLAIIHAAAPNAVVSLGWGGWQAFSGDTRTGVGSAMVPYFSDVMRESDFISVQAMDTRGENPQDIQDMADLLNREVPGKPIMVAHYKPDNSDPAVFQNDLKAILNDSYVGELNRKGVFAFSFMDDYNQKRDPGFYETFVVPTVARLSKLP